MPDISNVADGFTDPVALRANPAAPGTLFVAQRDGALFSVDVSSGAVTPLETPVLGAMLDDLAMAPAGDAAFVAGPDDAAWRFGLAAGAVAQRLHGPMARPVALHFDAGSGRLLAATGTAMGGLLALDPTGAALPATLGRDLVEARAMVVEPATGRVIVAE